MSDEKDKIEYRLIFLGNTAVGKTSLFKKITTGEFYEKNISTIGMDRRTIQFEMEVKEKGIKVKKNFEISLIDTAGQERFKSLTKSYYKGADGILLIYDVTNEESFKNVSNWINSIYEELGNLQNSKYIIFLIGNKIDLVELDGKEKVITEELAKKKCVNNNLEWGGEYSAKTFSETQLIDIIKNYTGIIYKKLGSKIVKEQIVKQIGEKKKKKKRRCFLIQ